MESSGPAFIPPQEPFLPRNRLAQRPITTKELQILRFIGEGLRNKEISVRAAIAQNTVKVHLRRIFQKLGVSKREDAAAVARQRGLID
jgi:DNA-binding NarL/FixJ family response regulator